MIISRIEIKKTQEIYKTTNVCTNCTNYQQQQQHTNYCLQNKNKQRAI